MEPTTFDLYSSSLGSLENAGTLRASLEFGKQDFQSEPGVQCGQQNVPRPNEHSSYGTKENQTSIPLKYIPQSGAIGFQHEEQQLKDDFLTLDVQGQGVLDAANVAKLVTKHIQRVDENIIERLMKNFTSGGASVASFSETLLIFYFLKRIKNVFQVDQTLPAYQAPSILQMVLPPDQHSFISAAIQKWLKSYYTEKITHQGLRGFSQDGFRNLDRPQDQNDGLNFNNILQMSVDAMEKKKSVVSPFS